ncbi:MAG TPA: bifunctional diguanylate cyclase/phosphodiesterase [Steroidobacteraceae bacterium]|nr:bifunctional diguanylate cyclase/phosphodiesterase [Steroidobacteraceae bacterium]
MVLHAPALFAQRVQPAAKAVEARSVDSIVKQFLWPMLREGGGPRILNRVRLKRDAPVLPYRIVVCPLSATEPAAGYIAALRPQTAEPFGDADLAALAAEAPRMLRRLQGRLDAATGLLSWPAFETEMSLRLPAWGNASIVYANLDQVHVINGLAGFAAGDQVIRRVGRLWRTQLPANSVATHVSGDRYAAVLFNHTLNQARNWAEQAREALAQLKFDDAQTVVTGSFGVVALADGSAYQHAFAAAETACRVAKDRGRNRVEIYDSGDQTIMRRHEAVRESRVLADALDEDRLVLHAQPIVALAPQATPYHYEILVRIQHPDGNCVSLAGYLAAAERYQLLERLDRWVIERVVRTLAPTAAQLHALGASFSVNITGQSLSQPEFADYVRTAIKSHDIPSGLLDFELTETAAARNLAATRRFIARMAEIGSRVALDDFGTGVSSLVHLKDFDVFRIKIDGKFVSDVLHNARSRALIRALVQIAEELGLDTVAEFVENAEIAASVRDLGVHYAQGYFYDRAQLLSEILSELCARSAPTESAPAAAATL